MSFTSYQESVYIASFNNPEVLQMVNPSDQGSYDSSHSAEQERLRRVNAFWGWIAVVVFIVVASVSIAVAFRIDSQQKRLAPNPTSSSLVEATRLGDCLAIDHDLVVFLQCGDKVYSYRKKTPPR